MRKSANRIIEENSLVSFSLFLKKTLSFNFDLNKKQLLLGT
jgi:hypothetical protein